MGSLGLGEDSSRRPAANLPVGNPLDGSEDPKDYSRDPKNVDLPNSSCELFGAL